MFFEKVKDGYVLRVRLAPNSSSCRIGEKIVGPNEEIFLKISVVSVPEKGKANKELIKYLSSALKVSKTSFKIISGETMHWKKILISDVVGLEEKIKSLKED